MNITILGVALMLIVCQAFVVCMFFVARRKQETPTVELTFRTFFWKSRLQAYVHCRASQKLYFANVLGRPI